MRAHSFLLILALVSALALGVMVFPQVASVWFLNQANAKVARAKALPADSPERPGTLGQADADLLQARQMAASPRAPFAEARVALMQNDAQRALDAFKRGTDPMDAMQEFIWGEAAYQMGLTETAFVHWRTAGSTEYFMQQAHRARDAGDWKQAEQSARVAVGIDPTNADAHYTLGDALASQSSAGDQALLELDRALSLTDDPELKSTILSRKGEWFVGRGEHERALALFDEARRIAPTDARPRTDLAITLWHVRPEAIDESTTLLKQVTDDSPWYTAAFIALADIYEKAGDESSAENWLKAGLVRNVNDPRLLVPLADLYTRQQRFPSAREMLLLALRFETHADALKEIATKLERLNPL